MKHLILTALYESLPRHSMYAIDAYIGPSNHMERLGYGPSMARVGPDLLAMAVPTSWCLESKSELRGRADEGGWCQAGSTDLLCELRQVRGLNVD